MYRSESVLDGTHIAKEQIEDIVSIALEVLKSLLMDTETPIDIRLRVALEIFELFGTNQASNVSHDDGVLNTLEKNARDIEKNADKLSCIETLIKMAADNKNPNSVLREEVRIIDH